MPDEPQSTPPNINIINIASDDTMWVLDANHDELLQVLTDPAAWVNANVKLGDKQAILWQPFVVVFHEVPPTGDKPTIHVQGIHETAILTVKYSRSTGATPPPDGLLPEGEVVAVLQSGQRVHTHLEFRGFTKTQVANTLFTAVTTPAAYIAALNAQPQTLNGVPTPADQKKVFVLDENAPPHITFQGWKPVPAKATGPSKASGPTNSPEPEKSAEPVASEEPIKPADDGSCGVGSGDANSQGQVIVDGVIVKTYSPWPK